ncbi:transcriptional regulator [Arthrobacter sp. MYb211]|uniref:helix-turn-helix transcriptional regulator n=1 Tax=unclassified Arthrobacter TaxID=235627 RepID=UPI000CFDE709|nr:MULTISPECIES: YafY family protein [unclassified Arthrobacter]PQZ98652.1 transcriptional regulator [Arthrobacter sp. MYb224]PRA11051.1 transcriptional regulator [Arthrobacter sp. MYb221]PRC07206.1 transcriptional regulator [Arthrobacter sp. MYb211]
MSTSTRFLRLISLLQTHRYWSGDELAERLEVSLRTVRRDIDRLRDLGYPVQADRGVGGGYQLASGAALPPLVLDDEEAVALVIGLQSTVHGGSSAVAEAALRALSKVVPVLPARLRQRAQALAASTVPLNSQHSVPEPVDPQVLVVFAQGCRDRERVAFDYRDAKGIASSRRVEPAKLVNVGNRYYLVAYDLDRADWRSFRVDRAENAVARALRFAPREIPGGDAAQFVREGLRGSGQQQISARVHASAEELAPRIGRWFEIRPLDEHSAMVRTENANLPWAAFGLAMSEAKVSDVQPEQLRSLLDSWSANLATGSGA